MKIAQLNIYPVKSLKGISVEKALVEMRGLAFDRRWIVVAEGGSFLSQRTCPQMATVATSLENGILTLAKNGSVIQVNSFALETQRENIMVWRTASDAIFAGEDASLWLSDVLGQKVRLFYQPDDALRSINSEYSQPQDHVSFADEYPILVCTDASLNDLNSRLATSIGMDRFRPNIVISGVEEAFAEDDWTEIRIGDITFRSVKPCVRCVMTTIDQEKGVSSGKEPLKTLATYRIKPEFSSPLFGQNIIPNQEGWIKVGDAVEVR